MEQQEHPLPSDPNIELLKADFICPECGEVCKGLVRYYSHKAYLHNSTQPLTRGKKALRPPTAKELLSGIEASTGGIIGACRVLGVSEVYFRKWAKILIPDEFNAFRNSALRLKGKKVYGTRDVTKLPSYQQAVRVLEGSEQARVEWKTHPHQQLKRLIKYGLMIEKCAICGFDEQRITDYECPVLLDFLDGDKMNWKIDNLRVLCYNCYFLNVVDLSGRMKYHLLEGHQK